MIFNIIMDNQENEREEDLRDLADLYDFQLREIGTSFHGHKVHEDQSESLIVDLRLPTFLARKIQFDLIECIPDQLDREDLVRKMYERAKERIVSEYTRSGMPKRAVNRALDAQIISTTRFIVPGDEVGTTLLARHIRKLKSEFIKVLMEKSKHPPDTILTYAKENEGFLHVMAAANTLKNSDPRLFGSYLRFRHRSHGSSIRDLVGGISGAEGAIVATSDVMGENVDEVFQAVERAVRQQLGKLLLPTLRVYAFDTLNRAINTEGLVEKSKREPPAPSSEM